MTARGKNGWAWSQIKAQAFAMHGRDCMKCGDVATEMDHIIELDNGGSNDLDNLQPLCRSCHKAKTSRYNSVRMTSKSNRVRFLGASAPPTLSMRSLSPKCTVLPPIAPIEKRMDK